MSTRQVRGHRALRKGRYSEPHRPYLLTTITHDRRPLFSHFSCARTVIQSMRYLHSSQIVESLAFVVMPDHLHWLCIPQPDYPLNYIMHSLKSWTANELSKHCAIQGPIWQPAYHDRALRKEEDIRSVARYIVGNPLRAGLVTSIGDYSHWDAVWL